MVGSIVTEDEISPEARLEELVGTLRSDLALSVFLSHDFSPAKHVGEAVRQHRVSSALEEAQRASSLLTANVRQEVIRSKEALLAEVEAVDALEKEVHTVSTGVSTLVTATDALSDALEEPFFPMRAAMARLHNLTAASNLLRAVSRFRYCTARLSEAGLFPVIAPPETSTNPRLPSAAEAVRELEALIAPSGPTGLEKVEGVAKDIIAVRRASTEVRRRAAALLKNALSAHAQTDVEAAVAAFSALGSLSERVNAELARLLRETQTAVHRGLEAPTKTTVPRAQSLSAFGVGHKSDGKAAAEVWTNIEKMLNTVADACVKVVLLQHVLSRKYCDINHTSLLHDTIASNFIDAVARTIGEQMSILSRTRLQRPATAFVFLTLAEGYPRLRSLLSDVSKRVNALARVSPTPITSIEISTKLPLIPDEEFITKCFFNAIVEVDTHYMTASHERLTKTVSAFYENGKQPGETEALSFAKMLAAELNAAREDKQLFRTAVSNIAKAIRLYVSQAEDYAAVTAPDDELDSKKMTQVEEWRLTSLYNGMVSFTSSSCRVLGENEDGSGTLPAPIAKELATLSRLSELLLDGPFSTCKKNIETVLSRMHTENLESDFNEEGCSVYVLDIAAQLSMFVDGIVFGLARSQTLGKYTLNLARWVLDVFLKNVVLVFPQSDLSRMRLSTDIARIELAVESLCPARLLGNSYKALRSLRVAILLPTETFIELDMATLEQVHDLPPSIIANMILGRSGDDNLKHPHRRKDLPPKEYVAWMESQSELERWEDIKETLNLFKANTTNVNASTEYSAIVSACERLQKENW